jgi:hypothetical protein
MRDKFVVKIPINLDNLDEGYMEVKFKTYQEISDYLQLSVGTIRTIVDGRVKFASNKNKHLQLIKIERLESSTPKLVPKSEDEKKEYLLYLRQKALDLASQKQ